LAEVSDKLATEARAAGLKLLGPGHDRAYRRYRFNSCGHEQAMATSAVRQGRVRCQACLAAKLNDEAANAGLRLLGPGKTSATRKYAVIACGHEREIQVTHVRRGNYRCPACGDTKTRQEATETGLELLGPGRTAHLRRYRFQDCGHEQELHVSAVRDGRVRCQTCLSSRLGQDAKSAGLVLIGPGRDSSARTYKFENCGHVAEFATTNVRRKSIRCPACAAENLTANAAANALTLLGPGRTSEFKRYRFNACGHERELRPPAVRLGHVRCQVCFDRQLRDEASQEALSVIGRGTRSAYRIYRFDACGHERELSPGAVRRGHVRCKVCQEAGLAAEAAKHGLTLIGKGPNANYRRFRFDACGHERNLGPSQVRRGVAFCRECFEATLSAQADAAGVVLIGSSKQTGYRKYRFTKCGHEQEMQPAHVRLEGFHCQTCNDSAWTGDGNVYVVALRRGDEVIYKVGLAKSVAGRITRYGLKPDTDIEIEATYRFEKYRDAHTREQRIHAALARAGLSVETALAKRYLTNGFTECYSTVPPDIVANLLP